MYSISKLSPDCARFVASMSTAHNGSKDLCNFATAKAVANMLSLSSGPVVSPQQYYIETVMSQVRTVVSDLSDIICVDAATTAELTRVFWTIRYNCAFPAKVVFTGVENSESYFLGYGNVISPDHLKFIAKNSNELTNMLNAITKVIDQLQATSGT